jgi:hypothetical protein
MWRVIHQYMDTMNGPADFWKCPKAPSQEPYSKTRPAPKWCTLSEFTADLIKHGKLELDPSRNDH